MDDTEDLDYWYEQLSILSEDVGCRPSGSDGEAVAVEYLRNVFAGLGFSAGDGTLNEYAVPEVQGVNLEAVIPAENENPAIIIIGAHYDSAPPVTGPDGNAYGVPGTRDNASGVAAMLTFAREFSFLPPFANTELRFVAFAAEEIGHLGSVAYVDGLSQDERERAVAMFNIDLITLDA